MTESHYAHVVDGKVVNMSIWDGVQEYTPPEGQLMVVVPHHVDDDGEPVITVGIDWDYEDGEFVDNRPAEPDAPEDDATPYVAPEDRIANLEAQVAALLGALDNKG